MRSKSSYKGQDAHILDNVVMQLLTPNKSALELYRVGMSLTIDLESRKQLNAQILLIFDGSTWP